MTWKTKSTDRFVLRFIKLYLSAPVSLLMVRTVPQIRPTVITFFSAALGISGGISFGLGLAWQGAVLAACAQILDGVDGQVARLTGRVSAEGALLDSFMDRYLDFALLFGILIYCLRVSAGVELVGITISTAWLIVIAGLAAAGCSQISYVTARAASLKLDLIRPEYAGKGSRTAVVIICGLLSPLWMHFPLLALLYLAIHPNLAAIAAMMKLRIRKFKTD